jgi:hypothetical protein
MFNHRFSLSAESSLVEGMGFLTSNFDHSPVLDGYLHSATVIAKGTPGKNFFRAVFCHVSNLLKGWIMKGRSFRYVL